MIIILSNFSYIHIRQPTNPRPILWLGRVWSGKKLPALIEERIYPRSIPAVSLMHPRSNPALPDLPPSFRLTNQAMNPRSARQTPDPFLIQLRSSYHFKSDLFYKYGKYAHFGNWTLIRLLALHLLELFIWGQAYRSGDGPILSVVCSTPTYLHCIADQTWESRSTPALSRYGKMGRSAMSGPWSGARRGDVGLKYSGGWSGPLPLLWEVVVSGISFSTGWKVVGMVPRRTGSRCERGFVSVNRYSRSLIWPWSIFFISRVWYWFWYGVHACNSNHVWIWGIIQDICKKMTVFILLLDFFFYLWPEVLGAHALFGKASKSNSSRGLSGISMYVGYPNPVSCFLS